MKILQMVDVPWDSGLAHYALVMSQGLKKEGHQVFVSAVPGQKPWAKARRLGLRTLPLVSLKGLNPLRRFLKEHRIDLVNAHTGAMHSLAVAGAIGQPVAVVRTRSDARAVRRRVGASLLYRRTQRVIAAADYIRDSFVHGLRIPSQKVVTVYQGVNPDEFPVTPLPEAPILGIVARLDPVKGHRYLLEALSILRDTYPGLRLRVIGQEENVKQRDLEAITRRLGITGMVEFLGFQSNVSAAMAECRLGIIPSVGSEAVSRVALEWMACGRPVIATRVGCLPEIVDEGVTGILVPPRDGPALARAIALLLHNPGRAVAKGVRARRRIEQRFALKRFVSDTLSVYHEAVHEAVRHR